LAKNVENMIVSSADLSNSDKTDGFLKNTKAMTKDDFSGAFLQAGVAELTMACVCIGMGLHGGVIAACGTFFVFSDYMKPAVRMAALMGVPVKFIWTHDAFRVGEDGPTHEPVEQEAQIRLMEKLKNHHGNNSMLVLRPADVQETTVAYQLALENTTTPTGFILSRQNIVDLPGTSYAQASKAAQGAYVVECDGNPDIVLLASGSEVATLVEGAALLRKEGITVVAIGGIRSVPVAEAHLLYTHRSTQTLQEISRSLLRYSSNFMANLVFLTCGAKQYGYPATWKKAQQAVHQELARQLGKATAAEIVQVEGAGLSRQNRVTARAMLQLLTRFRPYTDLLKKERGTALKTGTLTGVYNYAGYLPDGKAFVIILNQQANARAAVLERLKQLYSVTCP